MGTGKKTPGSGRWRFAVDRGGTFTDVVGLAPDGTLHAAKLPSVSTRYRDASLAGIRQLLGLAGDAALPPAQVECIRFGTTVATNALLERRGEPVALLVNRGFRELLAIGHQARPALFALAVQTVEPLYARVEEIRGRLGPDGSEEEELDADELAALARTLKDAGYRQAAVVLLHAWKSPDHELRVGSALTWAGLAVRLSHQSVSRAGIVGRGQTTLVDAYLSLVLEAYRDSIAAATEGIQVEFMRSDGYLARPGEFHPRHALLSGPAGGAVAVDGLGEIHGIPALIGFDMGGTSTDVCRTAGGVERVKEKDVAGIPVIGDHLHIVTVATGGGSVVAFDGKRLSVGPQSAGAEPGPACYGLGGPLTVTDANLLAGRLLVESFPPSFGPGRDRRPDRECSRMAFAELAAQMSEAGTAAVDPEELALGVIRLAEEKMALAIREVSVRRGFDPRDHALAVFGGAGGQHACGIARRLGMERILFSPLAGVFSAWGIARARQAVTVERAVLHELNPDGMRILTVEVDRLQAELRREAGGDPDFACAVELRRSGREAGILLPLTDEAGMRTEFVSRHGERFGYRPDNDVLEIVRVCVTARSREAGFAVSAVRPCFKGLRTSLPSRTAVRFPSGWREIPVLCSLDLPPGAVLPSPCLIADPHATLLVDVDFSGRVLEDGTIELRHDSQTEMDSLAHAARRTPHASPPDPVRLELFSCLFQELAAEMGHALQQTAESVNIRERLDFSCAVFTANGELVAHAPHIPVHLGAMGETVRAIIADCGSGMREGDVYFSNDPYRGGSHLPDVTVVCPVFDRGRILFHVAARGHHADMGGTVPGSMPPCARHIDEEGIRIPPRLLVRREEFLEADTRRILRAGAWPVRGLNARIADLQAQVAACRRGAEGLRAVLAHYGREETIRYAGHILDHGAHAVVRALQRYLGKESRRELSFADRMDDGTPIRVRITIERDPESESPESIRAVVDFRGTGPQHDRDNLNAPRAVTVAALLYVLRLVTGEDIPLNDGCLRPITLTVPPGTLLHPRYPAPVAAGNVETSQRVVDVLLGAFGAAAASQGTMNNLLFQIAGDMPYYETVGGGSGATSDADGASGVQTHMTNTRITDPEILEIRHPRLRLDAFHCREDSGGRGLHRGGDGLVREIRFLDSARVTVLSERRETRPFGLNGGGDGRPGINFRRRVDGSLESLPHRFSLDLDAGEGIRLETPGGGGYGPAGK